MNYTPIKTFDELQSVGEVLQLPKSRSWIRDLGGLLDLTPGRLSQLQHNPTGLKPCSVLLLRLLYRGFHQGRFEHYLAMSQVSALNHQEEDDVSQWKRWLKPLPRADRNVSVTPMIRDEMYLVGARLAHGQRDKAFSALTFYSSMSRERIRQFSEDPHSLPQSLIWLWRILYYICDEDDFASTIASIRTGLDVIPTHKQIDQAKFLRPRKSIHDLIVEVLSEQEGKE